MHECETIRVRDRVYKEDSGGMLLPTAVHECETIRVHDIVYREARDQSVSKQCLTV